jgi:hypothetical protein
MPGVGLLSVVKLMRCELLISVALLMLASAAPGLGQSRSVGSPQVLEAGNCEVDEANLDSIRLDARSGVGQDGLLIVIARPGVGDVRAHLNSRRLSAVKELFSKRGFPAEKIVLAEGERVRGNGRVEFYVGGKLTHVIATTRNRGLCIECCNPGPQDFTRARKRRRKG